MKKKRDPKRNPPGPKDPSHVLQGRKIGDAGKGTVEGGGDAGGKRRVLLVAMGDETRGRESRMERTRST